MMDRWIGKIAVVTGASSGIGEAVAKDLVKAGVIVIGLARRIERLNVLREHLNDAKGNFHPIYCDVSNTESIKEVFKLLREQFGIINILINCAGIARTDTMIFSDNSEQDLMDVINTNYVGAIMCMKEMFHTIKDTDADGYIINVNSILGHTTPLFILSDGKPCSNAYTGTKHALKVTNEAIRQELNYMKKPNVRIGSISPGMVKTELVEAGNMKLKNFFDTVPHLRPEDISQTIIFMLGTPKHVQIHELIIKPVGEMI